MSELELFIKLDEFITPHSEAYHLIESFDRAINGTYQDAWNELCAHYDNPRLQVESIISKLMTLKAVEHCREDYMRAYTAKNTFVHSLPRMNIDVTTLDPIIVHIVEKRMHDTSFKKWIDVRNPR